MIYRNLQPEDADPERVRARGTVHCPDCHGDVPVMARFCPSCGNQDVVPARFGAFLLLTGCVYYNALYNAERLYEEGEAHRRSGRDSLAAARQIRESASESLPAMMRTSARMKWRSQPELIRPSASLSNSATTSS